MHRILAPLIALTIAGGSLWAAEPPDMGGLCAPIEQRSQALEHELAGCRATRDAAAERERACSARLADSESAAADLRSKLDGEHAARERLCAGAAELADGVAAGQLNIDGVGSCVPAESQGRLARVLAAWKAVTDELSGLAGYLGGDADTLPRPSALAIAAEQIVGKLLGVGRGPSPILYRRLLAQAMQQIAPQSWRRIRAGGAASVDAWLTSSAPLDPAIADEARARARDGSDGGAAASALQLVRAYETITDCGERGALRSCRRAAELRELLETSGPLVMRRRTQDIWSFDCTHVGPPTIAAWLRDVPGGERLDFGEITDVAFTKLYTCFIDDAAGGNSFLAWLERRLPGSDALTATLLARVERVRAPWRDNPSYERCADAARALQTLRHPTSCALPDEAAAALGAWAADPARTAREVAPALRACRQLVRATWQGRSATIPASFLRPPAPQEIVVVRAEPVATSMSQLRDACADRRGALSDFAPRLLELARLATAFGETASGAPWYVEPRTAQPAEATRAAQAATGRGWLRHLVSPRDACETIAVAPERCRICAAGDDGEHFDCALVGAVAASWRTRTGRFARTTGSLLGTLLLLVWGWRLRRALVADGLWTRQLISAFAAIELSARASRLRWLFPARWSTLRIALPAAPAWERWGRRAVAVRSQGEARIREADVQRAADAAQRAGATLALLVHDEGATPDLAAVRALLDWVARGGRRAVQIVPVSVDRMHWVRSGDDLLDLVEQTSLRGNPFDLRGRITHSSQFFDRERLVSGLLAGVQAGHWLVVTGLRRFGKSSLALEVARRLPGPSAYVDLAGFCHEIAHGDDPARAADAILGYLCQQLVGSARTRWPRLAFADAVPPALGAAELTSWMRRFVDAVRDADDGRAPNMLLILDEVEQALSVGPDRLAHALAVLSIVVGRLRSVLADPAAPPGGGRIGLLLCSALHPLLWAPLTTLAHQSLMGAFATVCVPRLANEAAASMLRALGAGHGIRFTDEALALIVDEAQGIPLLVRRIATSVLELYDPERARQGGLGAVEIGVEGVRAAVRREEEAGSPFRVWVESEIADTASPAGVVLRRLAHEGRLPADRLRATAQRVIAEQFAATGIDRTLPSQEALRRAQEAAGVLLRLLADTGLLVPHGDLMQPEAFELADSAVRAVLAAS